jgi:flagellar protein FlbD
VIALTRLSGSAFVLNCDLIERVEESPDTVITLLDGKKYVVAETVAAVVAAIREHRRDLVSGDVGVATLAPARLSAVRGPGTGGGH